MQYRGRVMGKEANDVYVVVPAVVAAEERRPAPVSEALVGPAVEGPRKPGVVAVVGTGEETAA